MGLRSAIEQTGWLPIAVLLVLLWTIVTAISLTGTMQPYSGLGTEYVGQSFLSGGVGLLVLLVFGAAVAYLYSEAGESEPAPDEFPPQ
jgi:hypothetical protein